MNFELKYPLLNRKWKWIAYALFPFPIVFLLSFIFIPYPFEFPQESVADFVYLCWAIGFGLLIFIKEPTEDEMIEQLRLKAFAMGVFYLFWGLVAVAIIQVITQGTIFTDFMSAYSAVWLLNTYIFLNFQYLKWKNR
ncbi:hypothetical protein QYS49_36420 [Marivirga salinae]|uniref:Uncharacterized protein n=1 Tax=Marivirga salinarum TaxID=3059078 RepID=A0AA51N989_9BACT|nr:hypothetical protein [Marivirga sp. BDSF4-3]WMN10898.1 hypothetical protein QYS49_36420 [Marivirga sp. BDSF4-3]